MTAAARPVVYLAGPDVFYRDAVALGREKSAICARLGMTALYPLDNEVAPEIGPEAARAAIYRANIAMIDRADAVLANVTPFKGVDADAGAAFEIGYAVAQGKPVHLYSARGEALAERHRAMIAAGAHSDPGFRAKDYSVDDFAAPVNLMLWEAAAAGGSTTLRENGRAEDLALFEAAARRAAAAFRLAVAD